MTTPPPIPAKAPPVSQLDQRQHRRNQLYHQVLGSFQGKIDPVARQSSYRIGIFVSAVVMFIIPLIYFLTMATIGTMTLASAFFLGPFACVTLPIGMIVVFLMFRPIISFFTLDQGDDQKKLIREKEPLLFDFVDKICDCVHAPKPKSIRVNNDVNAGASLGSIFGNSHTCELTIGLPLVAGLNMRQLGGVLAHEFGHFSQGVGMRMTGFIRLVNHWLLHCITHRDGFDYFLERTAREIPILGPIAMAAQAAFWLLRRFLWLLMMLGHLACGVMMRQMEFDADHYENRLVGIDSFIQTQRLLRTLGLAHHFSENDIFDFYRDGRLGDNFPYLVIANFEHIDKKQLQMIDKVSKESETGIFDSHPCDRERILNVASDPRQGIFHLELPASLLFDDFDRTSRALTTEMYKVILGKDFDESRLHKSAELFEKQKDDIAGYKALNRFLQGLYFDVESFGMPRWQLSTEIDTKNIKGRMEERRQAILDLSPGYLKRIKRLHAVYDLRTEAEQMMALTAAGFDLNPDATRLGVATNDQAIRANQQLIGEFNQIITGMQAHRKLSGQRMIDALELTQFEKVAVKLDIDQSKMNEIRELLRTCKALKDSNADCDRLRFEAAALHIVFSATATGDSITRQSNHAARNMTRMVNERILKLQNDLNSIAYPFDHADGNISIGRFLLRKLPFADKPESLLDASAEIASNFEHLAHRAFGRVVTIVEQVENLFGFAPFPEPEFEDLENEFASSNQ